MQTIDCVKFGDLTVTKLILGGNPFSGVSHMNKDLEMKRYYTVARIKDHLKQAEQSGINTFLGRCDNHITRLLIEYWDEGGTIQWIAQSCPERANFAHNVKSAVAAGAKACFVHGGHMDSLHQNGQYDEILSLIKTIRSTGVPAGIASHHPNVIEWAEQNTDCDFFMCCYYNPSDRAQRPEYVEGVDEKFVDEDRDLMTDVIGKIKTPVIHYKILAAGRKTPHEAFEYAVSHLKDNDAICFGVYTKEHPNMIKEDVQIFKTYYEKK